MNFGNSLHILALFANIFECSILFSGCAYRKDILASLPNAHALHGWPRLNLIFAYRVIHRDNTILLCSLYGSNNNAASTSSTSNVDDVVLMLLQVLSIDGIFKKT